MGVCRVASRYAAVCASIITIPGGTRTNPWGTPPAFGGFPLRPFVFSLWMTVAVGGCDSAGGRESIGHDAGWDVVRDATVRWMLAVQNGNIMLFRPSCRRAADKHEMVAKREAAQSEMPQPDTFTRFREGERSSHKRTLPATPNRMHTHLSLQTNAAGAGDDGGDVDAVIAAGGGRVGGAHHPGPLLGRVQPVMLWYSQ